MQRVFALSKKNTIQFIYQSLRNIFCITCKAEEMRDTVEH